MSMVCKYRPLTADEARRVREDGDYLMSLTAAEVDEPLESGGGPVLDIHKSWHGLHWLLCQQAWDGPEPLKHAVLGGEEIGEDLGYGPARLVDAAAVRAVAAALAAISRDTLRQRFNPMPWQRRKSTPSTRRIRTGATTSSTPSTASSSSSATPPAGATASSSG